MSVGAHDEQPADTIAGQGHVSLRQHHAAETRARLGEQLGVHLAGVAADTPERVDTTGVVRGDAAATVERGRGVEVLKAALRMGGDESVVGEHDSGVSDRRDGTERRERDRARHNRTHNTAVELDGRQPRVIGQRRRDERHEPHWHDRLPAARWWCPRTRCGDDRGRVRRRSGRVVVLLAERGGHHERGGDGDGEPPRRTAAASDDLHVMVDTTASVVDLDDDQRRVSHVASVAAHTTGHGG